MAEPLSSDSNAHLITGLAGAGKSETGIILASLGYDTINLDTYHDQDGQRLCYWGTDDGTPADMPEDQKDREKLWGDPAWLQENYWRWRPEIMQGIILGHDHQKPLFLEGRARNQEEFFPYFGTVVLLHITAGTMLERFDARKGDDSHSYGQDPVTQRFLATNLPAFEHKALAAGAILLDTTSQDKPQVAHQVLRLCLDKGVDKYKLS